MMRKIKILISLFVIMLILSMDLGTLFSKSAPDMTKQNSQNQEIFDFENLQHNLGCIAGAIKSMIGIKTDDVALNLAGKYEEVIADTTTKAVEKAIDKDSEKTETAK